MNSKIAILGAGSWGGTLSCLLANAGRDVTLWSHNREKVILLQRSRKLMQPMTVGLPESVTVSNDLAETFEGAQAALLCCKAQVMREVAQQLAQLNVELPPLVSTAKGMELHTLKRMSEVLREVVPSARVAALSGPNLAPEIMQGSPAASVVASEDEDCATQVQQLLSSPLFRVYSSTDLIGVELGGILKNIMAIAAGCSDGLNLGTNAKAALLTRGLSEMTRFATALGAKPLTLSGLSGMGDLFATCTSSLSRNYRVGFELAKGQKLEDITRGLGGTAEGVTTTEAVCELSKRLGIELPIAEQVEATLKCKTTPKGAIMTLMTRPLSSE
jgi:glycerol-3-phosphate dehydrogenase (NAD(P)+)